MLKEAKLRRPFRRHYRQLSEPQHTPPLPFISSHFFDLVFTSVVFVCVCVCVCVLAVSGHCD